MHKKVEPTLPGNPHKLTMAQHVFPKKCIERFVAANRRVELFDIARGKQRNAKPEDASFCARRAWDQRAEIGYMKDIEDAYQRIIEPIATTSSLAALEAAEHVAVSRFYALWYFRSRRRELADQFFTLNNVAGESFTKFDLELLESKGLITTRPNGMMASRHLNAAQIQISIDAYVCDRLRAARWRLISTNDGEFCVPDTPHHAIIPIAPTLCLALGERSGIITKKTLAEVNRAFIANSSAYYFARNLGSCLRDDLSPLAERADCL